MSEYIVGLTDYAKTLRTADEELANAGRGDAYLDLTAYPLSGVEEVDRYTYRIKR